MAIHRQDCHGKERLEEVLLQEGWEKSTQLGMPACSPTRSTLVMSVCRRHTHVWEKRKLSPMWVKLKKRIVEEPTPLIDQVYLGCTQRGSVTNKSVVKLMSGLFAKIATTDTEAKFKIKKPGTWESRSLELRHEGPCGKLRGTLSVDTIINSLDTLYG